ncbi:MAG: hypothetical protein Q4P06_05790 [Actinomycetaceae bacterium]|nr:hypothetical protein [Actinomycetaceae bacterium]
MSSQLSSGECTVFTPAQMARMFDLLIDHITGVVPLLDELDELYGGDGDTGSNALRSITAIRAVVRRASGSGVEPDLDTWASAARTVAIGHAGMLLASVISSLAKFTHAGVVRPVELRRFCLELGNELQAAFQVVTSLEQAPDTLLAADTSAKTATDLATPGADTNIPEDSGEDHEDGGGPSWMQLLPGGRQGESGDLFEGLSLVPDPPPSSPLPAPEDTSPLVTEAEVASLSAGLERILAAMAKAAQEVAEPIEHPHLMIGAVAMEMLSELADFDSPPDPGTCLLVVTVAAMHAAYEGTVASLPPTIDMMRSLWEEGGSALTHSSVATVTDASFISVDLVLEGFSDEVESFLTQLTDAGKNAAAAAKRFSHLGTSDAFGMQTWRFHIDTEQPESVLPTCGSLHTCVLKDSRGTDSIGFDELALREAASGVVFLTRPTTQRAATARVIAFTDESSWLPEAVATGAHVLFNPSSRSATVVAELLMSAPAGVSVVVAHRPRDFEVARRAQSLLAESGVEVEVVEVPTVSTLATIMAAGECARIFMPALAHRNQKFAAQMLSSRAAEAALTVLYLPADTSAEAEECLQALGAALESEHLERVVVYAPHRDHSFAQRVFAAVAASSWRASAQFMVSKRFGVDLLKAQGD